MFLLMDVLEHVPDDFQMFSQLLEAARPGAYFLVTVPANKALWSEHDESFGHYRRYDADRLASVWSGLPVKVLLHSYYNARLYPLIRTVRFFTRFRKRSGGIAGTDFKMARPDVNDMLRNIFAAEGQALVDAFHGRRPPYRRGVSLVALLRREPGPVTIRHKPPSVAPDLFNPAERELALAT
jgi:hypothetical protein